MIKGGITLKNRILSALLCIALLTSIFPASSFASHTSSPMQLLKAMEVLSGDPDGNMRPYDLVTRAEFAKMAVLLSSYKTQVALNSKISVFSDCTADHWAAPYVKTAAEAGIVAGYSSGLFGPDHHITYAQAVTVALRLLGYTDEDFGYTYPQAQLGMAQTLKLNAGIDKSADEALSRYDVSVIFVNTLTTSAKNSSADYISSLGYTLTEDCIIVASHLTDSSVPVGKVITSEGEYSASGEFDYSVTGSKGSALVTKEGRLVALFAGSVSPVTYAVYAVGSEHVTLQRGGEFYSLNCDDGTLAFSAKQKTTYGALRSTLSTGDIVTVGKAPDGTVDYIIVGESDFDGPYTVGADGNLASHISTDGFSVVRNGEKSTLTDIRANDIVYYSSSLATVFAYSKKVSGIYASAYPNSTSPTSVTVGSAQYTIESPIAFSKLCSGGKFGIGDNVVLLLGKDGGLADVMTTVDDAQGTIGSNLLVSEGSPISAHAALLGALGAVSLSGDDISDSDSFVTRGEFAKMAVMSSVHRNKVSLGSALSIFPDCTASYWATPYVKTAVENGLMSAFASGRFMPDDPITFVYVIDAALSILGYDNSDFSDWPSAQLSMAESLGISDGVHTEAFESVTKDEAALILYRTLCTKEKASNQKVIEKMGYGYYDKCVIMASSRDNSSVSAGKVLTSEGTFSVDESTFDYSSVGKSGQLLVSSGKVAMFNAKNASYTKAVVHSALPGGLALMAQGGIDSIAVSENTTVYSGGAKTTFGKVKNDIAMGDTAVIYYDISGKAEYVFVDTNSLSGPYVCTGSDWYTSVSGAHSGSKLMKDGREVDSLCANDILYYSSSLDTVFAYDDKVIGIFEDATPSKTAPDSVVVSGVSYKLTSGSALPESIKYGDTLTLCLGRDGSVVHGYTTAFQSLAGYLIGTGVKEFKNTNDESYTSIYVRLVLADGSVIDCAADSDYSKWINTVMSITFSDGKVKLASLSSRGTLSGEVNIAKLTIGKQKISESIKILDVGYVGSDYPTIYTSVFPSRLNGVNLSTKDILYAKTENGLVTELILNDATGDAFSYGVVTSANTNISDKSASGSYSCDIGGSTYTYSGGAITNIQKGSFVKTALSGGRMQYLTKLVPQAVKIKECDYTSVTLADGTKHLLAEDVVVYRLVSNSTYTLMPVSELYDNLSAYSYTSICTDSSERSGGRVRIIILKN